MRIAKPIAASAPAKVRIYSNSAWPIRSESKQENKPELKDAESKISSIETSNRIRFLRVIKIPRIPKKNISTGKTSIKNICVLCI
jgi:hypothetical protein